MKGVIFDKVGAEPKVSEDLQKPVPKDDQVLVKSLWAAINPVDAFIGVMGLMIVDMPVVLGVDAGGVIVEAGATATSKYGLKVGDYVCGCTRLGTLGYNSVQEFHLMDAALAIPKPSNISVAESCTVGVGILTASLGVFEGLKIDLPSGKGTEAAKEDWVIILGGSGSVGKFAVQLARACGYKVLASCSAKSASMMSDMGADAFDYKLSQDEQVKAVLDKTGGSVERIFDTTAGNDPVLAKALFKASNAKEKHFSTTNDWSSIGDFEGGKTYEVRLGGIGQPRATELNGLLEKYIPVLAQLIENGLVKPAEYHQVGTGVEAGVEAFKFQGSGKGGSKKVVIKIQDE